MSATRPERSTAPWRRRTGPLARGLRCALRAGFALPAAIFLLVILAALGAFIVAINTIQTSSTSLDVLGANGYQAAKAGTEWGAFQALRVIGGAPASCFGTTTLTFPGTPLGAFTTTVTCSRTSSTELGTTVTVDLITADACNDPLSGACPNPSSTLQGYVARQVQLTVGQP